MKCQIAALAAAAALVLSGVFYLQDRNGLICWREDAGPWQATSAFTSLLPHGADRQRLLSGISLPTKQALTRALEDFCS